MPYISLRVTEEEKGVICQYADLRGISQSAAIKNAFFEKIDHDFAMGVVRELKNSGNSEEVISQETMTGFMENVFGNL